jgi:energy-coupling factor transport system permease protein
MVRDITLGQYYPGNSLIQPLGSGMKIVLTLVFIVFIFVATNFQGLAFMLLLMAIVLVLSGVPLSQYLKSLKP